MKYIDYIGQRINLHKEIVKSIIEVMDKYGKDLTLTMRHPF